MPGIADVFRHFGRTKGRLKDFSWCPTVDLAEHAAVCRVGGADDRHGGFKKVGDRGSLAHELGIYADAEVFSHFLTACLLECRNDDGLSGSRQDRTAQYDKMERGFLFQDLTDVAANGFDVAEVQFSVAQARSSHAKKGNLRIQYCRFRTRCSVEASRGVGLRDECLHARLDDRTAPSVHRFDLARTQIHTGHVVTHMSEASGCHGADVAKSEHANCKIHAVP